jgi:hypothetical protein
VQWIERRIEPGEPFRVEGPCLVVTTEDVVLLDPDGAEGGRFAAVAREDAPQVLDWRDGRLEWELFDWVLWCPDGHGYRLRIGSGRKRSEARAVLTGLVESVEGEFSVSLV